jgi:hypothetical protein
MEAQVYGTDPTTNTAFVNYVDGLVEHFSCNGACSVSMNSNAGDDPQIVANMIIDCSKRHMERHFELHKLVLQGLEAFLPIKNPRDGVPISLQELNHTGEMAALKQKMREWVVSDKPINASTGVQIITSIQHRQQKESEQARRRFLFKAVQSESLKTQRKQLLDNALHSAGVYLSSTEMEEYHIKETYHSFIHCAWTPDVEKAVGIIYNYQVACKNMEALDAEIRRYFPEYKNKSFLLSEEGIHCYDRVCYYWGAGRFNQRYLAIIFLTLSCRRSHEPSCDFITGKEILGSRRNVHLQNRSSLPSDTFCFP